MESRPVSQKKDPRARRAFALEVVEALRRAGYQSLWAGGCVRDLLLGKAPDDYDVATDATPERVMALFRRTIPVGASFGVVQVLGPQSAGYVEVATFRSDLAYVDGRRPEGVVYGSPQLDAARRDFTINGMFFDPIASEVIDYVGGRADLDARILRAIGDPSARFAEDKLRLLRAVRFAARLDLVIESTTLEAIRSMAAQVQVVAPERISQELRKMLLHQSRGRAIQLAHDLGILGVLIPDLAMLHERIGPAPGTTAWSQTIRTLEALGSDPSAPLATAALLHAIGGSDPGSTQDDDDHEDLGRRGHQDAASRARRICRDLRYPNVEMEQVGWLIAHQDALREAAALPRSRLKRLLAADGVRDLIALHRAIAQAEGLPLEHVAYCERYLQDQPEGPIDPPPLLNGDDLKRLGLTPGAQFRTILEAVRDAQLDGVLIDRDAALRWVLDTGAGSRDEEP